MHTTLGAALVVLSSLAFLFVVGGEVVDSVRRGYKFYKRWDRKYIAKHFLIETPVFTLGVLLLTNVIK